MAARKDHTPGRPERSFEVPIDPELVEDLGGQLAPARELEAELEATREEAARNLAAAQRWQAEFENFRKRQAAVAQDQAARAGERIVERLLPAIDDLERAIDHAVGGGDVEHLLKGVEVVRAQILDVLVREGVEVIDPFGEAFDPNLHHAVSQRVDTDLAEHTVVEVFQKGYRLGCRVIRPAMVVVSSGGPERAE
ncbi:MAG TPA: nucleotide exchange factor GrpE [Coriobacteriia bacterium]